MKKVFTVLAGAVTYLVLSLILTAYDHLYSHKKINVSIAEAFVQKFSGSINEEDKFYNYIFTFNTTGGLEGEEVSAGGMVDITSSTTEKNVTGWIEHGGFSADEPNLPASFVHFYDPTQPPGERYLKDLLDAFYISWGLDNPQTDHVEWAISDERNEYTYEAGKQRFKNALEQPDEDFRRMEMAFAWRALGQTLHLIADMGIASHVRDDAHPGVGTGMVGYKWAFDADPYESVVMDHSKKDGISGFMSGSVDPAVQAFCRNSTTAKSIAEKLAAYTNSNFFSHETISGTGVIPKIHPEKTYPAPKLESCNYDEETAIFSRSFGGNSVKMCKDLSYLSFLNDCRGYPYIDEECILSQATALFPQIREAGVNVMKCFIPDLEVTITGLTADSVMGKILHHKDAEYPMEIKYNGPVQIRKLSNRELIGTVDCETGEFRDKIDLSRFDRVVDKLYAEIECGYVFIKSDPFESPLFKGVSIRLSSISAGGIIKMTGSSWTISAFSLSTASTRPLVWNNGGFSSVFLYENEGGKIEQKTFGTLSSDLAVIEDLRMQSVLGSESAYSLTYVDFKDVPAIVYPDSVVANIPDGQAHKYIEELTMESVDGDTHNVIETVFWSNIRVRIVFHNKLSGQYPGTLQIE
jgi:hypothetical protein